MREIRKIEATIPQMPKRKKVAAYARVSVDSEQLLHSLSAQVSYYSKLIQNNPNWEYAGVYADEGISGTGTAKRKEFLRMISDCEKGKIDLILVKSLSRMSRNTVDLLNTVRHLKEIGVEVRFERENISTFTEDGEFLLTLLASYAQCESESISENVKWGKRKKFSQGHTKGITPPYGYKCQNDKWVIVPEEVEIGYLYGQFNQRRWLLNQNDADDLEFYREVRNKLAHLTPLTFDYLQKVFEKNSRR